MQGRGRFRDDRGVALVEFALIAPVLLLVVAGMLGFGRLLFYWIDANHLANEATRWAAVDQSPYPSLQDYVANAGPSGFKNGLRVCLDYPQGDPPEIGESVRVRVQKPYTLVPIVGISLTINASSTQRIERLGNVSRPSSYAPGDFGGVPCT